ncbi:MAG: GAF domain-containing protein [Bacteroidota bacterium]
MDQNPSHLQQLLQKIVTSEHASKGNIQLYDPSLNGLKIVAQVGFEESFLKHFSVVKPFDTSTCGRAFGIGSTVVINDIETDIGYEANRPAAKEAGYRAVKSVPVFNNRQKCIGMISTHYAEPNWNWDTHSLLDFLPEVTLELEALLMARPLSMQII